MNEVYFILLIGLVAFLYSSVGHGGASGYLAVMALFHFAPEQMRSSALILNLMVSAIAFFSFYKQGKYPLKKLYFLLLGSVPAAFIGAQIKLDVDVYKIVLGVFLWLAAVRMILILKDNEQIFNDLSFIPAISIGATIGLVSGILGIGGGVILSPILILFRWATIKEAACISAAFIWVNSLSGLGGLYVSGITFSTNLWILVGAALIGGVAGSLIGSKYLSARFLKIVLAIVLFFAGIKLIIQ